MVQHLPLSILSIAIVASIGMAADHEIIGSRTDPVTHTVIIREFAFDPEEIEIQVGDSIRWINEDSAPHTATRTDATAFDTGLLRQNEERTIQFTEASPADGFGYFCVPHPFMTGRVKVLLAGSALTKSHSARSKDSNDVAAQSALPDARTIEVHIKDASPYFEPNIVEIQVGDSIKWINDGNVPHTATRRDAPAFNSGVLSKGQSVTIRFDSSTSAEGIKYFCIPHPYMTGIVVVKLRGSHLLEEKGHSHPSSDVPK